VVVSRALTDLAEFLHNRQESAGRGRVILDRRVGERRRAPRAVDEDRRQSDRRRPPSDPTEALMRVLGFMVVPTGDGAARPGAARRTHAPRAPRRSQAAPRHRGRRRSWAPRPGAPPPSAASPAPGWRHSGKPLRGLDPARQVPRPPRHHPV